MIRLLLLGLVVIPLHAFSQYPYTRTFPLQDGTHRADGRHVVIDDHGSIWVGGEQGLFRTDGSRTERMLSQHALNITCLEASNSNVLLGTRNGAILRITASGADTVFKHDELSNFSITALVADGHGAIWIGTYGAGLWRVQHGSVRRFNVATGMNDDHVNDLLLTVNGLLVVATDLGCAVLDTAGTVIYRVREEEGATDNLTLALTEDEDGRIWVGTDRNGVFSFMPDAKSPDVQRIEGAGRVNCIAAHNNMVWVGTHGSGILVYDLDDRFGSYKPNSPEQGADSRVSGMVFDAAGALWWCDGTERIRRSDPNVLIVPHHEEVDLTGITALCSDKDHHIRFAIGDRVYLHTSDFVDEERLHMVDLDLPEHINIVGLHVDVMGTVWIGTMGAGLYAMDPSGLIRHFTSSSGLANDNVLSIRSHEHTLWFATLGGVSKLELDGDRALHTLDIPGSGFLYDVLPMQDGGVLLATDGDGLIHVNADGSVRALKGPHDPDTFYSLCQGPDGSIWATGPSTGLCRIGRDSIHCVGSENVVFQGDLTGLAAYKGWIFVVGDEGLVAFDPGTSSFTDITDAFGIQDTKGQLNTFVSDQEDALWSATDKGLIRLRPSLELLRGEVPTAIIGWKWGLEPLPLEQGVQLAHDQNFLSFSFIGSPSPTPEHVRFAYRLIGFDERPISTSEREVVYSRLPPGDYTFEVRAFLGVDSPASQAATLEFSIAPVWWRTKWAVALWVILLSIVFFAFVRAREARYTFRQRMLREKEQLQLDAVRSQVNPHFLFNSFNTLIELIEEDQEKAVAHVADLSTFFRNILHVRDKELIPLHDELELTRTYFELEERRFGASIALQIDVDDGVGSAKVPPMTIQMLVENALKHNVAAVGTPLVVRIEAKNGHLVVSNPYRPRMTSRSSTSYGLESIRKRYRAFTTDAVVVLNEHGTFTVQLPLIYRTDEGPVG